MPKTLDTHYKSKLWSGTINKMQILLKTELDIYPTYISPAYKETGNLGIRIWPTSIESGDSFGTDEWTRRESFEIVLYSKGSNADDSLYEQLFNDFDNIWQLIFENKNYPSGSSQLDWMDGKIDSVAFNQLTDDEVEINGLHSITMEFSCITTQQI